MCSTEYDNGPWGNNVATWVRYGAHGGAADNLASVHNKSYASGFSTAQTVVRFIFAPLTIPGSWVLGFVIATFSILAQAFLLDATARLIGEVFGTIFLELTGKRRYYQRKAAYYDLAAQEIQRRQPGLTVAPGIQII